MNAWAFQCVYMGFSLLKSLFKSVFLVLNFDSLLEFKLLLEILDLGDKVEVNYKCSWVEKYRRVLIVSALF